MPDKYTLLCATSASPFLLLLPFFPLFQINRVALIQCVSCRLPWRLFDPVFQSLPLGQTCFSSVCCTPALEAPAALRQTMGCCARLAPPFFFLSLSLSILSPFFSLFLSFFFLFFSFLCSDFFHLSVSLLIALLPFGHTKVALPQRGHAECPGQGKRPGPQRSSPPGRKKRGEGPLTLPLLPTLSPCL